MSKMYCGKALADFKAQPYLWTYSHGLALTMPRYLYSLRTATFGASHCTITFLGLMTTGSGGAAWKMTRRLTSLYGSHLSIKTDCGLLGIGASLSITTLRGGGGSRLPEMVISLRPTGCGAWGGASRIIRGSGVDGLGGCWRITSGGAGAGNILRSWVMIISPGAGGVGGLRYLIANSCMYCNVCCDFLVITWGVGSSLIKYSQIGRVPFQLTTSDLLANIPRLPRAEISSVS